MGVIYSVCMNKGGVGKTSLISNLAGAIAKKLKKKVLIIDLDGQGNSSMAFGVKNPHTEFEFTMYDVLMGEKKAEDILFKADKRIHILPSNKSMNHIEFRILPKLKQYGNPFLLLKKAVGEIIEDYDFVFIDTPPSLGLLQGNALTLAENVLIPFHPEPYSDIGLISVIEVINEFKENYNSKLQISGVVGMKMEKINNVHNQLFPLVLQYCRKYNIHVFETIIPKTVRFASSTAFEGKPATMTDLKHPSVALYYELLGEVLEHGKR